MKRFAILFSSIVLLAAQALAAAPSRPGEGDDVRNWTCQGMQVDLPLVDDNPLGSRVAADIAKVVQGNNAFALDLYHRLRQEDGNLFYSPYSISTALAMAYAGARGETAEEMARVLHFSLDGKRLHPAFSELIRETNGRGLPRDYQLSVAQSLWGDAGLLVHSDFQELIRGNYGPGLRRVDFRHQHEIARQRINHWVEERTNDKIKELLQQGNIDEATRMVLVNAIYFKGAWQNPFEEAATEKNGVFHTLGKTVKAALMHQTEHLRYAEAEGCQAVELPYEGGDLSMVVVLPREKDGLGKLEQSLTSQTLDGLLSKLESRDVAVTLPRFKLTARFELAKQLAAMGMPRAFDRFKADFSGISDAKVGISEVIHQAFVDVNEGGTEAAAATAVIFKAASAVPVPPTIFRADHPFLFLLRDHRTGSILFVGRVIDPSTTA
jgi:serpin B